MTFTKRLIGILTMLVLGLNVMTAQTIIKGNDRVVKVNKTVITANELENTFNEVNKLSAVYGRTFTKKEVLKTMIDEELLKSEVRKQNLVLDENQVKQEVDQIRYQYSEMMYQSNPNFKFNESEFRAYIEKEGNMTYQKFEDKIKDKVLDDMRESPNEARRLDYDNLLVEKDTNVMDTMLLIAIRHTDDFSSISLNDFAQLDQEMMKRQVKVMYDGPWVPEGFTEKNIDFKAYQFSYKVGRDRIFQRSVYLRDRQRYYIISMSSKFGKLQVIDDENNFFWDNVEVD